MKILDQITPASAPCNTKKFLTIEVTNKKQGDLLLLGQHVFKGQLVYSRE